MMAGSVYTRCTAWSPGVGNAVLHLCELLPQGLCVSGVLCAVTYSLLSRPPLKGGGVRESAEPPLDCGGQNSSTDGPK